MVDPTILVPDLRLADVVRFAAYMAGAVVLPGWCLRRLVGFGTGRRWERWALTSVLGLLWVSVADFVLAAAGCRGWHLPVVWLPVALWAVLRIRGRLQHPESARAAGRQVGGLRAALRSRFSGWDAPQWAVLALIGLLVAGYLVRVSTLARYGDDGLRLYGAFYSDKLTNMSPCAALLHGVPPDCLRLSGYAFPSHYFPHLFVAAAARATGIDYVDLFWFHAAALGIAVKGLAVAAFCRRMFRSGWVAWVAVAVWGLSCVGPEEKPLDVSLAMLLLAILALDRHRHGRRARWAVLAVGLIAAMPCYEVFHAATALGGLVVWAAVGGLGAIRARLPNVPFPLRIGAPSNRAWSRPQDVRTRFAVAAAACVTALLVVRVLYLGAELTSPPQIVLQNSYRDSYRHEWRDLLRDSSPEHSTLATLYFWKRGKPFPDVGDEDQAGQAAAGPGGLRRAIGQVVYNVGFLGYVFVRFVDVAVFGIVALAVAFRRGGRRWGSVEEILASVAAVGLGVPMLVTWGRMGDGQWWETPNIYRLTSLAHLLLVLAGTAVMVRIVREWRRPRFWPGLALVGWQSWVWTAALLAPVTSYHLVPPDRLEALAFLRTGVPYGEVVIHPWVDDLIRNARRPHRVDWVYKRHFTLGSNLAGQMMYYEGREDHLFINGFVSAEEVYRRSSLRRQFYEAPEPHVIEEVVYQGRVRWVVADRDHPAPPPIAAGWDLVFSNATVRIYRRSV